MRERQGDIPLFIDQFIQTLAERSGKAVEGMDGKVLSQLVKYEWPGNVRELENVVEYAVALAKGSLIQWEELPGHLQSGPARIGTRREESEDAFEKARHDYEASMQRLYLEALRAGGGDVPTAAQLLGMSRATFYRRIKKFGLKEGVSKVRYEYQN